MAISYTCRRSERFSQARASNTVGNKMIDQSSEIGKTKISGIPFAMRDPAIESELCSRLGVEVQRQRRNCKLFFAITRQSTLSTLSACCITQICGTAFIASAPTSIAESLTSASTLISDSGIKNTV